MLERFFEKVTNVINRVCQVLIVIQIIIVSCVVFGRFVLNKTPGWGESAALFCMVWFCLLSSAIALQEDRHLKVNVLELILSQRVLKILDVINDMFIFIFALFMFVVGIELTKLTTLNIIPGLGIKSAWLYLALPITGFMMLVVSIEKVIKLIKGGKQVAVNTIAVILLIGLFLLFILLRMPIVFAIGVPTIITTFYLGLPLATVAQNMVKGINVFALLAVPFFIVAGEIMGAGGISNRLIKLSNALVGWIRGGLAMVNIVASMFFGGISGSSAADTSSIGSILIPIMKKDGYDEDFATTVTMASSVQGILIPPSHNMVIYSLVAGGVSIGKLFLGGLIPGIFLGIALMIFSYIVAVKRNYPVGEKFNLINAIKAVGDSGLGLVTVLIVVVGVITGIFTATESAAIACVYAFIITFFVYREIPLKAFGGILTNSIKTLSIVMILIGTSGAFGWLLAYLRVPKMVADGILGFTDNRIVVLIIMNLILLFLGMIMDMSSIILIAAPILVPIATQVGIDPVHFGVIMVLNLGIGLITPPVGSTLFIGSAIAGVSMERLSKAMIPFYIVMVITLILITYCEPIVMFLPNLMLN